MATREATEKEREKEGEKEKKKGKRDQKRADGRAGRRAEGRIQQIIGAVVDVEFTSGQLPEIFDALEVERDGQRVVLEVEQAIGDNAVRCISMQGTDGLRRGDRVQATGGPIRIAVGQATLGRMFNVIGEPIDGQEPLQEDEQEVPFWPIHRQPPPLEEQQTEVEILETGIKVIDL